MSQPILVTGAARGSQGATGQRLVQALIERGLPVRAFVHRLDERADALREQGAEVVQGDLLDPDAVRAAMHGIKRAYFTYPVADGLLEATANFAQAARDARTELVVNMSQLHYAYSPGASTFRSLQHRLADQVFNWAAVGAVHLGAAAFYESLRALVAPSVAEQNTILMPWGSGDAVFPLVAVGDVVRVAAALLSDPASARHNAYELVGATPTVSEIADAFSRVLGRRIRYVEISDERWRRAVAGRLDAYVVDYLSHLWQFVRTSGTEITVQGRDAIAALTGTAPQTLEQFVRENRDVFAGI